jgi:hypothetical protein
MLVDFQLRGHFDEIVGSEVENRKENKESK